MQGVNTSKTYTFYTLASGTYSQLQITSEPHEDQSVEKIKGRSSLSLLSKVLKTQLQDKYPNSVKSVTYDHRLRRTGHPVRSAIHKPQIGRLVVGWVTTSEYLLLYVFLSFFCKNSRWRKGGVAAPERVACCANRN